MQTYGGAAAAAFWTMYWLMDFGYGFATMFRAARGGAGRDTSANWETQDLAREYFLRCFAFPKWASLLMLPFVVGSFAGFVGALVTWNPRGHFVDGELVCVAVLALIALLPLRSPKQKYLESLFSSADGRLVQRRIQGIHVSRPMLWLDVASFHPL